MLDSFLENLCVLLLYLKTDSNKKGNSNNLYHRKIRNKGKQITKHILLICHRENSAESHSMYIIVAQC